MGYAYEYEELKIELTVAGKKFERVVPNFDVVARRSTLIELNGGHNDCVPDWSRFWNRHILPFLKQAVPAPR